jgi:small subunit ribosomal protein S1
MSTNINDEAVDSRSFEEMLNDSMDQVLDTREGDKVKARIIQINDDTAFCDIGAKNEAVLQASELYNDDGECSYKPGDEIDAVIVSTRGDIELTTRIGRGKTTKKLIQNAFREKTPVEGTVSGVTKGGLSVSLGNTRAFCPRSQVDTRPVNDLEALVGSRLTFLISKFEEGGRNIVLSRRDLLDLDKESRKKELMETLSVGDTCTGTVSSSQNFGIFVDLEGYEALVPKSELSWSRSSSPSSFPKGSIVTTKVIDTDWENDRLTLSIKEMEENPWNTIDSYSPGQVLDATITAMLKSGAIAEFAEGLEGFIHLSRMSVTKRINKPEEVVKRGERVKVSIDSIDRGKQRISLSLITGEKDPWAAIDSSIHEGVHEAVIESSRNNGLSVRLENGIDGFVPTRELKNNSADIQTSYPTGSVIHVAVKDMNINGRKCILSERLADSEREREEFREYSKSEETTSSSLGALFKDTFDQLKKDVSQ